MSVISFCRLVYTANRNARQNLGHAALIKAAYDALSENGAIIVVENIIDGERRGNAFGLLMSLNMLIEFGDAFDLARRLLELVQRSRIQKLRSPPPRRPMQRRHRAQVKHRGTRMDG
jgi:hypothetical protein